MIKSKNYIIILLLLSIGLRTELFAQSFSIDSTFQCQVDLLQGAFIYKGTVSDLYEDTSNGNIYVVGDFQTNYQQQPYYDHIGLKIDGSYNSVLKGSGALTGPFYKIHLYNDTTLLLIESGNYIPLNFKGNVVQWYRVLQQRKTVPCAVGIEPYVFKDNSILIANSKGSTNYCNPKYMGDTLPHQYIVKVDPQGIYDSTFNHSMNFSPTGFYPYDSNHILIYGLPRSFTIYDGDTINGLCRTDLNGNIDTTFKSNFNPGNGGLYPALVQKDGKILIKGTFQLQNYPGQWFSLIRLNINGSLDTTFLNFDSPIDSTLIDGAQVNSVVMTEDNGYLVSGHFNKYQGFIKNGLAKIDSTGKVEPQYFTSRGPDSSITRFGSAGVLKIIPSQLGGYYLLGTWKYWNGQPSQPIIKIHGLNTSVGLDDKNLHKKTQYLNTIYPTPTNTIINLEWLPNQKINQISLFDLQGRLIKNY